MESQETRNMDLIMYVLYSSDHKFVFDMMKRVAEEVADTYGYPDLLQLFQHPDHPMLFQALFFLLLRLHDKFRHWVITEKTLGLPPCCEYKVVSFLRDLQNVLIHPFLIDKRMQLSTFLRNIKVHYIRA